jgi:hypothetical protein
VGFPFPTPHLHLIMCRVGLSAWLSTFFPAVPGYEVLHKSLCRAWMLASVHCLVRFLAFGKPKEVTEDADGKGRAQYSSVPGGTTEPSGETSQNGRWLPGPPVHSGGWTPADFNCTRKEMKARVSSTSFFLHTWSPPSPSVQPRPLLMISP